MSETPQPQPENNEQQIAESGNVPYIPYHVEMGGSPDDVPEFDEIYDSAGNVLEEEMEEPEES